MRTNVEHLMQKFELLMQKMTRGDLLAHSISFALIRARKVVLGLYYGLTENERWEIACRVVEELKKHSDQCHLDDELKSPVTSAHSTTLPIRGRG
jgi:hypothetical protein